MKTRGLTLPPFVSIFLTLLLLTALAAKAAVTPLVGNATVAPSIDMNPVGQAEAFQFTATASGTMGTIMVYVDGSSTATTPVAGLYSNNNGHPGTLLAQGSLAKPTLANWNAVTVPP